MGIVQAISTAFDAVFPEFCTRCSLEGELLCSNCRGATVIEALAHRCPFCERETGTGATCRRCARVTSLDGCLATAHYAEPAVKGVVKSWKYDSNQKCEKFIQAWLRRSNLENVLQNLPWALVPASLHPARDRERGFDQAEILAQMIGQELSLPVENVLQRKKRTQPQARSRRQLGELHGAFSVVSEPPECVLLVDDVLTSGATLDAAAHALKQAGSEIIWGLVLARGQ